MQFEACTRLQFTVLMDLSGSNVDGVICKRNCLTITFCSTFHQVERSADVTLQIPPPSHPLASAHLLCHASLGAKHN